MSYYHILTTINKHQRFQVKILNDYIKLWHIWYIYCCRISQSTYSHSLVFCDSSHMRCKEDLSGLCCALTWGNIKKWGFRMLWWESYEWLYSVRFNIKFKIRCVIQLSELCIQKAQCHGYISLNGAACHQHLCVVLVWFLKFLHYFSTYCSDCLGRKLYTCF